MARIAGRVTLPEHGGIIMVSVQCPSASHDNPVSVYGFVPGLTEEPKYGVFIGCKLISEPVEFQTDGMSKGLRIVALNEDGSRATDATIALRYITEEIQDFSETERLTPSYGGTTIPLPRQTPQKSAKLDLHAKRKILIEED